MRHSIRNPIVECVWCQGEFRFMGDNDVIIKRVLTLVVLDGKI